MWSVTESFEEDEEVNIHENMKKLMIDLIGPELRIGYLEGDMGLSTGAHVIIGHGGILVPEEIMPHIRRDQEILLDDGKLIFEIVRSRL